MSISTAASSPLLLSPEASPVPADPIEVALLNAVKAAEVVKPNPAALVSEEGGIQWKVEDPALGTILVSMQADPFSFPALSKARFAFRTRPQFLVEVNGHILPEDRASYIGNSFNRARKKLFEDTARELSEALEAINPGGVEMVPFVGRAPGYLATVLGFRIQVSGVSLYSMQGRSWNYSLTIGGETWVIPESRDYPFPVREGIVETDVRYDLGQGNSPFILAGAEKFMGEAWQRLSALRELPQVPVL